MKINVWKDAIHPLRWWICHMTMMITTTTTGACVSSSFPRRLHMNIWKDATRLLATRWLSASRDLELSPAHAGFLNRNCKLVAKIINLITKSKNGVPSRGPRDAPTLWLIRRHESWVMTFMTQGNVIFDILEPNAFRKYSTCWVLQKFEEPCRILKKFVHACVVNVIHAKALPGSVLYFEDWIQAKSESNINIGAQDCSKSEQFEKWLRLIKMDVGVLGKMKVGMMMRMPRWWSDDEAKVMSINFCEVDGGGLGVM